MIFCQRVIRGAYINFIKLNFQSYFSKQTLQNLCSIHLKTKNPKKNLINDAIHYDNKKKFKILTITSKK